MTHWDELERELRLSVHPTFADKLLDDALESDNMLGAYGEIADLVATLRAPATAAELGSQADAVAEMSKLLRSGPGGPATGVVMASKKAMAVAAAAASLATGSAFAAGLPAAVENLAATVSGALVRLVDGGGEPSVAEAQAAPEITPPAPEQQRSPAQTPVVDAGAANAAPETEAPPTPEQGEAVPIEYNPPADVPDAPESAREPRAREAALPVGAGAGPLNPDDGPFVPPASGGDEKPAPPAEEPPVLTPEGPPSKPPPPGSGADFQPPAPLVPPFVPVDDESDGTAVPAPAEDTGSEEQGDGTAGGGEQHDDSQGGGDDQGGQGDDGSAGGDNGQGDHDESSGDDNEGGDHGGGDPGQGDGGGDPGQSDGGQGDQGCQSEGSANANGNGNANGHCKQEDGDDHNHGGGNG